MHDRNELKDFAHLRKYRDYSVRLGGASCDLTIMLISLVCLEDERMPEPAQKALDR